MKSAVRVGTGVTGILPVIPTFISTTPKQQGTGGGINPEALDLGSEGFHLETRGNDLYLLGGGRRGVLYGVYDLLESLGCRWFTPEIHHIPRLPNLSLPPLRRTGRPAFENRDTFNRECHDPAWWVRNRLNGWYTDVPEYMGGNLGYCGFVHTFYGLLPPEEFFDDHPEYFSLVAGQRQREMAQLCLTHPDVLRIVSKRLLERMRLNPQATIFSVSQNDCYGPCECEACSRVAEEEGSQSGPLIRFVNAVAEETSKHFPGKLVDTLAYQYSLEAPRHAVPHPNVRVRLCSITCCQGHTYGTCDHPESLRFLKALQAWARITDQMYVWHYATNFTHYPLPMPDFDELHGNINLYRRTGVRGLFIQGMGEPGGGAESMALRGYLVSKLLWQPEQPVWPLVDEFLPAYYGAAAPAVRRYLEIFHQAVHQDPTLHPSLYDLPSHRLFDDDLRLPAAEALAEAEKAVRGEQRERVRLLRGGLDYARLYRACGRFERAGEVYAGKAAPGDLQDFKELARTWRKAGIQRIREGEDFTFSLQKLRSRLSPHPVFWLEDEGQRLAVVPDLGGRIIEWQAGGWQWLLPAQPDSTWSVHPYSGGYAEFAVLGMYSTQGWGEAYRASWQGGASGSGRKLVLSARLVDGLHLQRWIWLQDGAFHLRSRLRNNGDQALTCGWGAALQIRLAAPAQFEFQDHQGVTLLPWDGSTLRKGTSDPRWPVENSLALSGEKCPQGGWRVTTKDQALSYHITGSPLGRFSLSAERELFRMEWRTSARQLSPGEAIEVKQKLRTTK